MSTHRMSVAALAAEHDRINARYQASARELFPELRARLLNSRPVVGERRGGYHRDKTGRRRYHGKPTPVYGAPTFRNRIDENGAHV